MRTRASELLTDHFRVSGYDTEDLLVWEGCADPLAGQSLVAPVFVTQIIDPVLPDPLTLDQLS